MRICPFDLEPCAMPGCAGGTCEKSGEAVLTPCAGCGGLIVLRSVVICVDCTTTATTGNA